MSNNNVAPSTPADNTPSADELARAHRFLGTDDSVAAGLLATMARLATRPFPEDVRELASRAIAEAYVAAQPPQPDPAPRQTAAPDLLKIALGGLECITIDVDTIDDAKRVAAGRLEDVRRGARGELTAEELRDLMGEG